MPALTKESNRSREVMLCTRLSARSCAASNSLRVNAAPLALDLTLLVSVFISFGTGSSRKPAAAPNIALHAPSVNAEPAEMWRGAVASSDALKFF